MDSSEIFAYLVFIAYFGLILISFVYVFKSILDNVAPFRLLEGRPFLFLRIALAALLCTWYFMLEFMKWSFREYSRSHKQASIGQWLKNTALFEQAWAVVCDGPVSWWWSSYICTWAVGFTAVIWFESGRRDIKHRWAYMLLGQLVAISVSTSLFLTALYLHPRIKRIQTGLDLHLHIPFHAALAIIAYIPTVANSPKFLPYLLLMHVLLFVPLAFKPEAYLLTGLRPERSEFFSPNLLYGQLAFWAFMIHSSTTKRLLEVIPVPSLQSVSDTLYKKMLSHPAQASISMDVLWVAAILAIWFLVSGSLIASILKLSALCLFGSGVMVYYTGVNWTFVGSVVPILGLALIGLWFLALSRIRSRNVGRRAELLKRMGIVENEMIPGTDKTPPKQSPPRTVVGFWHPYCNSGGGGERVLWTAIAYLQKKRRDVVCIVYTGDFPEASKDQIIGKVQDRFSIELSPATLNFIPLPSRFLVDGEYWNHFTLLGQSLGSIYLAWQGLCGKDGVWGDVFLDSMGYAFTWPFVRLIAGPEISIGAYVHYPTVSSDMIERVRTGSFGIENASGSKSGLRTQGKLLYYRILTTLYSTSLLFSEWTMTNSSWTQGHITSILSKARNGFLSSVLLMDDKTLEKRGGERSGCEVVYPPCDTKGLVGLGKLDNRQRTIISLAQFRPEKEHEKQVRALACLLQGHPEYRDGVKRVTLTMAGGVRHPADQARVDGLRKQAEELGVSDNIEFLINAPYPEIVERLGEASIGLNSMQDEHFGINVVEFMAAGLIPVVHASAGPKMDIVVPYEGQETGFHAKTAEEFADRLHQALSLSSSAQGKIRRAARAAAKERFSEGVFEHGFEKAFMELQQRRIQRLDATV